MFWYTPNRRKHTGRGIPGRGRGGRLGRGGMARCVPSDLNRTKLPMVISNRTGMFRTVLLHIIQAESVQFLHVFEDSLKRIATNYRI